MNAAGRSLSEFLRTWWWLAQPLADRTELDVATVAALVDAAAEAEVPALRAEWRTADHGFVEEPVTFADWEAIVLGQVCDLADFDDHGGPGQFAYFGTSVPRPAGIERANLGYWFNFDPKTYLECGTAGTLGGWDDDDGLRSPVPGPSVPLRDEAEAGGRPLARLTWADLGNLAIYGQTYE